MPIKTYLCSSFTGKNYVKNNSGLTGEYLSANFKQPLKIDGP